MCGIFGVLNNKKTFDDALIKTAFDKGTNRGPEDSKLAHYSEKLVVGFKRLAINGLNSLSSQPMTIGGVTLVCNGEIYNYKELYAIMGITPTTGSDCEVIIRMYKKYGFEYTVEMLDGVFALMLLDESDMSTDPVFHVARDPFGVRPLYVLEVNDNNNHSTQDNANSNRGYSTTSAKTKTGANDCIVTTERIVAIASEIKMLVPFTGSSGQMKWCQSDVSSVPTNRRIYANQKTYSIKPFTPGTFSSYSKSFLVNSEWQQYVANKCFFKVSPPKSLVWSNASDENTGSHKLALQGIFNHLDEAVRKRVVGTTERPIACLLSGGLDSSIITALVNKHHTGAAELKTFSIGMRGSEDLKHARMVADHLGTDHTEIIFGPDELFQAIPEVIEMIESYDTTTVRASVGNYLIGKYISQNTDVKVVFNGDGSDEVTGGYLYFLKAPDNLAFDKECRRLVADIHTFDVLRSDRCISSNGLEPRTPFLDKNFVDYFLSLPIEMRNPCSNKMALLENRVCEKYLLRQAIIETNPSLLPESIVWRTKEAFSDGVSGDENSWYEVIQKKVEMMKFDDPSSWTHNTPQTLEQTYYRTIYESLFPGTASNIPYFWMPKFVKAEDCSARTLEIYSQRKKRNK